MGQYHDVYNKTKKEKINGLGVHSGWKLLEQIGYPGSTADILFALLANSNGRGGGDLDDHELIGRWAGDEIVIQGDYAEEDDPGYISPEEQEEYIDISEYVLELKKLIQEQY